MKATTDREREIAGLVNALANQGTLKTTSVAYIATSMKFSLSEAETRFLVRYVVWRRSQPAPPEK